MKKPVPGKNKNPGRHLITAIAVAVIIFAVFYLFMAALTEMRWNKESMTGSGIPVTAESQYGGKAVLFLSSYSPSFATTGEEIAAMVIQADSNVYIAKSRRDGMFIGSQFTP
jgi:hypothetical protein